MPKGRPISKTDGCRHHFAPWLSLELLSVKYLLELQTTNEYCPSHISAATILSFKPSETLLHHVFV